MKVCEDIMYTAPSIKRRLQGFWFVRGAGGAGTGVLSPEGLLRGLLFGTGTWASGGGVVVATGGVGMDWFGGCVVMQGMRSCLKRPHTVAKCPRR
jgi:hypothetical protein